MAPEGGARIFASGRTDRVVGVPGPAKSSSVWRWSMSLGRDAEAAEPAPALSRHDLRPRPNVKANRDALWRPVHRQFRLGDRLGALAVDAWAVPGLSLIRPPARSETDGGRFGFQQARRPQPFRGPPCPAFARSGLRPASFLHAPRAGGGLNGPGRKLHRFASCLSRTARS